MDYEKELSMMEETKYKAFVRVNGVSEFGGSGDDLQALIVSLMVRVDTENTQASGEVVNAEGKRVYSCRKVMCE